MRLGAHEVSRPPPGAAAHCARRPHARSAPDASNGLMKPLARAVASLIVVAAVAACGSPRATVSALPGASLATQSVASALTADVSLPPPVVTCHGGVDAAICAA